MKYLLAFFMSLFVVACNNNESANSVEQTSNEETDTPVETDSVPSSIEIEGMIHLEKGNTTIGSNDKDYKANEKPAMKILLDYDFYIDEHEVTCGEYARIAKKAKLKSFGKCENDSLPIVDVTYYDAVLYANAKSKLENHDTAYSYSKAIYDNDGHCTELEGFAFHPDANAFRLPTEAEWVYAATRAWNTKKSWNSKNSDLKLQPVCGMGKDSTGFCDMAGNAMEWVNDWMGSFKDTTVTNYVGSPDGGEMGERIVKGGSYKFSTKDFSPYSRGDVYAVTSATRADYVGFRLAFGSIPSALWINNNGKASESIITPLVNAETIKKLLGTYNVKLAFRNDISGNITYLNYQINPPAINEITEGIDAYHPDISPNGEWIAYCTGLEGISGKSTLYVQSIDKDSSLLIKLKVESAAIPRWRILENGDTVIVYVTDAGNNKDKNTFKSASTWQVSFSNGKFGTPQKLFDGAFHGGISEDNTLAVTGARLLRARTAKSGSTVMDNAKDAVWYDSSQACNASLSLDGTKRTAFLDFAGKPGKKFAGESYATHERVFIADSNGKLIQSIKAPTGYTFDHTEWATNGENSTIIATLTNSNGAHTKIALINPTDSSSTEIAEGDELWHPNLWIKKKVKKIRPSSSATSSNSSSSETNVSTSSSSLDISSSSSSLSDTDISSSSSSLDDLDISSSSSSSNDQDVSSSSNEEESSSSSDEFDPYTFELDPDSAGIYYTTSGPNSDADQWRYKMEFLWQYKDTANLVVLGSSRGYNDVNPLLFNESIFAINLAVSKNVISGTDYFFNNYVLPHMKKLKYVVLTVDNDLWHTTESFFTSDYKAYPGYVYDANHNFWKDGVPEELAELTYESLGNFKGQTLRNTRGFYGVTSSSWGNTVIETDSNWLATKRDIYYKNFESLKDMVKKCYERNIILIGVITPRNPKFKETGSFGSHGLLRSEAPALIQEIADISNTYPNFILMDENKMGDHDYTSEMAFDSDHLNELGAKQLTTRIDSVLQTLE